MKSAPAIPLFGDAYLADTRHLRLEEHGAYLQLLMIAWRSPNCSLPDDDRRLATMLGISAAKWGKIKPTVMAFWTLENGFWTQRRLTKERAFVEEKRAKNSASANARWKGQVVENIEGEGCERISERNAPPPPPLKKEEKEEGGATAPKSSYAFEGRTIRLTPSDLAKWQKAYHAVPDIVAELTSLDAWFEAQPEAKRKSWFHTTAGALNRKHQEVTAAERSEAKAPAWDGMP